MDGGKMGKHPIQEKKNVDWQKKRLPDGKTVSKDCLVRWEEALGGGGKGVSRPRGLERQTARLDPDFHPPQLRRLNILRIH